MQPTEFYLDYQYLKDKFEDIKHRFNQHSPNKVYEEEMFNITDRFLKRDKLNYLKFGPYWWAMKAMMFAHGFSEYQDSNADPVIREAYTVRNPDTQEMDEKATFVAAWEFKDYYNQTYLQGNREFQLWDNGEIYSLVDEEWENR